MSGPISFYCKPGWHKICGGINAMSRYMSKLTGPAALILALTFCAGSRTHEETAVPNLRLTLSSEKKIWARNKPALVKVTIENLSEGSVEIPPGIDFQIDGGGTRSAFGITRANPVFWSPVSLTKIYSRNAAGCQNDLTEDRVKTVQGTNIVEIHPAKGGLTLGRGEAKKFSFNLAGICWNHEILSDYPRIDLFTLIKEHSEEFKNPNTYKVYFEIGFDAGSTKINGMDTPLFKTIRSNEVEIEID
jgi:hypothetical protein